MAVLGGRKGVIDACFPCYKINPDLRMVEPAPYIYYFLYFIFIIIF